MAQHTPSIERARRTRPETSAWLWLICFFLVFCAIVAGVSLMSWRYYTTAMVPLEGALVRVHAPAGVGYQPRGSLVLDTPNAPCDITVDSRDVCKTLNEGDQVQAKPQAGYGPVASIVLDKSTRIADLYAYPTGTNLELTKYQASRWTQRRKEVEFTQTSGYVRYDIPDKLDEHYAQLSYTVTLSNGIQLSLTLGGSYSVNIPSYDEIHPPVQTPSGKIMLAEVAVRTGSVEVIAPDATVIVRPGQKVMIDRELGVSDALPARWQLIRNGNFPCEKIQKDRCGAWVRTSTSFDPTLPVAEGNRSAAITVYKTCRPERPVFCRDQTMNVAQFFREGNQQKSFIIGVIQDVDLDVSEYRSLQLSLYARVIKQTLPGAGIANIECPITIQLDYRRESSADADESRKICVYQQTTAESGEQPAGQSPGGYVYQPVPPSSWYLINYDLRNARLLPDARYLKSIVIYANGHDYISEVAQVSLLAQQ